MVCCHPEGLQITEIETAAVLIACCIGRSAKRRIGIQPAIRLRIKHSPVMCSQADRIAVEPGFPAGGYTGDPAKCDKEQRLNAAVSPEVCRTVFRDTGLNGIVPHVRILHIFRNIIIDPAGDLHRPFLRADDLGSQGSEIRCKTDMRILLTQILLSGFSV